MSPDTSLYNGTTKFVASKYTSWSILNKTDVKHMKAKKTKIKMKKKYAALVLFYMFIDPIIFLTSL